MQPKARPIQDSLLLAILAGCASTGPPGDDHATAQHLSLAARTAPPETPAGFSLTGAAVTWPDEAVLPEGACVSLHDRRAVSLGGDRTLVASTTTDSSGRFTFTDLPEPSTLGFTLLVASCDTGVDVVTSATSVPGERVGGRGTGDTVADVVAWAVTEAEVARIDAAMAAAGGGGTLTDGGIVGRVLDSGGSPVAEAWVRGPESTPTWYDQGDEWEAYVRTTDVGGGRIAVPHSERYFGTWIARAGGLEFPAAQLGGLDVVEVHDFTEWTPRVASVP